MQTHNLTAFFLNSRVESNNINFFYAFMYCLPLKELEKNLLCLETKSAFREFTTSSSEETVKRYILSNSLKLLANRAKYSTILNSDTCNEDIDAEINYYTAIFSQILDNFDDKTVKNIKEAAFKAILLVELTFNKISSKAKNILGEDICAFLDCAGREEFRIRVSLLIEQLYTALISSLTGEAAEEPEFALFILRSSSFYKSLTKSEVNYFRLMECFLKAEGTFTEWIREVFTPDSKTHSICQLKVNKAVKSLNFPEISSFYENYLLSLDANLDNLARLVSNFEGIRVQTVIDIQTEDELYVKHHFGSVFYNLDKLKKDIISSQIWKKLREEAISLVGKEYLPEFSLPKHFVSIGVGNSPNFLSSDLNIAKMYAILTDNFVFSLPNTLLPKPKKGKLNNIFHLNKADSTSDGSSQYFNRNLNSILNFKTVSLAVNKFNKAMFSFFLEKQLKNKFSTKFSRVIRAVMLLNRLTEIYKQKKVLTDFNHVLFGIYEQGVNSLENVDSKRELVFDFNCTGLDHVKTLNKLNLSVKRFKKFWKVYLQDTLFLVKNKAKFTKNTSTLVEERKRQFGYCVALMGLKLKFQGLEALNEYKVLERNYLFRLIKEVYRQMEECYGEIRNSKEYSDHFPKKEPNFEEIYEERKKSMLSSNQLHLEAPFQISATKKKPVDLGRLSQRLSFIEFTGSSFPKEYSEKKPESKTSERVSDREDQNSVGTEKEISNREGEKSAGERGSVKNENASKNSEIKDLAQIAVEDKDNSISNLESPVKDSEMSRRESNLSFGESNKPVRSMSKVRSSYSFNEIADKYSENNNSEANLTKSKEKKPKVKASRAKSFVNVFQSNAHSKSELNLNSPVKSLNQKKTSFTRSFNFKSLIENSISATQTKAEQEKSSTPLELVEITEEQPKYIGESSPRFGGEEPSVAKKIEFDSVNEERMIPLEEKEKREDLNYLRFGDKVEKNLEILKSYEEILSKFIDEEMVTDEVEELSEFNLKFDQLKTFIS